MNLNDVTYMYTNKLINSNLFSVNGDRANTTISISSRTLITCP